MFAAIAFALAAATPLATAADRLLADYSAAWSRADSVALAALYTPDGELVSPAGSATGRADIAQLYGGGFANGMAATVLTAHIDLAREIVALTAFHADLDGFLGRCAARPPGKPCPVATDFNRWKRPPASAIQERTEPPDAGSRCAPSRRTA